jgi:hypothetical protein
MKPSPTNTLKPEDDCGEFAVFDSLDAIAAYVHYKRGDEALRQLFTEAFLKEEPERNGFGPKEFLEDTATELEKRGLDKPAAILRQLAKDAISGIDLVPDYMVRAGPGFVDQWRENWIQRRHIELGTWGQELRRHEAERARQSEINKQKPSPTQQ